jgi:hypothetical protein
MMHVIMQSVLINSVCSFKKAVIMNVNMLSIDVLGVIVQNASILSIVM